MKVGGALDASDKHRHALHIVCAPIHEIKLSLLQDATVRTYDIVDVRKQELLLSPQLSA